MCIRDRQEYNAALAEEQALRGQINRGELSAESEEYAKSEERLSLAKKNLADATTHSMQAEQQALNARNSITNSYKSFATQLRNVGGIVSDVGGKAPVSYTHLDVYKRQGRSAYESPARVAATTILPAI